MKKHSVFLSFLFITLFLLLPNCGGDSGNTASDSDRVDSGDEGYFSPTGKVTLYVYTCSGELLSTFKVDKEGEIRIQLTPPYSGELKIIASRDGAYSGLYSTNNGGTINVNLDPAENDGDYHGMVFGYGGYNMDFQVMDYLGLRFFEKEGASVTVPTNVYGRYTLVDGKYLFADDTAGSSGAVSFTPNETYKYEDLIFQYFDNANTADTAKPNIYLYPEATIDLSVSISFPQGGHLTKSDPEYGNGWDVTVEPDGTIDNYHTFLFYEALVPAKYQEERGFVVKKEHLEEFFTENLTKSGFEGQEIEDFLEWWMIRLLDSPYYVIYPQYENDIAKLIQIEFSQKPDNFRRLYYLVQRTENPEDFAELEPPTIPPFERKGFFAVDWGLVQYRTKNSVR